MAAPAKPSRLDRPVDPAADHVLGPASADIVLVEYGSYACPHCRAANERIADVRDEFGERLLYVFRQRPLTGSDIARRAAELAERAQSPEQFWDLHLELMTRSAELTEDDLVAVAGEFGLAADDETQARAKARVEADEQSARTSGVAFTPTFFINGRRYDGAWDSSSFADAMRRSVSHRLRMAAFDFAAWAPSGGALLLLAAMAAMLVANSPMGSPLNAFWSETFGLSLGAGAFAQPLIDWINEGLLSLFFLVVGLEIKREFTIGSLANRRSAGLPIAAAIGGMALPAALYALIVPSGPWAHGWGAPMATDTAFAIALVVLLGARVPVELRIFLTAASIVDDIGAIGVIAIFYSDPIEWGYLAAALAITAALALFNYWRFYRMAPYAVLGLALWFCVHEAGLHGTLAGVVLAFFIPTRPPANLRALMAQAGAIVAASTAHEGEVLRHRLSAGALRALDAIHDRLESPADRFLRQIEPWSTYLVLPLFAFANAGLAIGAVDLAGHAQLATALILALAIGKPLGLLAACALAVRLGIATKPEEYSWTQILGAGALAGIGFTMSLFIAGEAFPNPTDFAAAKLAIFAASAISGLIGVAILWRASASHRVE